MPGMTGSISPSTVESRLTAERALHLDNLRDHLLPNLVTNHDFETNTTGWTALATGAIARITTDALIGTACLQVTSAAIGDGAYFRGSGNAGQGDACTSDVWVKAKTAADVGKTVQMFVSSVGGVYESPYGTTIVLSAEWQRIEATGVWANASHTGWDLTIRCDVATASFLVDYAQHSATARLESRLTAARAALLDNLDAAISSRLGAIASVQRGTIAGDNASATRDATISAVTLARAELRYLGYMSPGTYDLDTGGVNVGSVLTPHVKLNDTTTVRATWTNTNSAGTISYEVTGYNT